MDLHHRIVQIQLQLHTILKDLDGDGNAEKFKTGAWKSKIPVHSKEKCKNCMLCPIYCPEDCIKQKRSTKKETNPYSWQLSPKRGFAQ